MALLCLTNQGNIFKEIGFKCFKKYLPEQLSRMQKIKNMDIFIYRSSCFICK